MLECSEQPLNIWSQKSMLNSLSCTTLACRILSEPGSGCSEQWSPERTFVLARTTATGFSGIQELSELGFKHPFPVPFEVVLLGCWWSYSRLTLGLVALCYLVPWFPGCLGHLPFCQSGGQALAELTLRQIFVYWFFPCLGAGAALQKWINGTDSKETSGHSRRERSRVNSPSAVKR